MIAEIKAKERISIGPSQLSKALRKKSSAGGGPGTRIVVEVLSPTNSNAGKLEKLAGYSRVPGLTHYLVVHPTERYVIHHKLGADPVETRIVRDGDLRLDPPGLVVPIADMFLPEATASA